MGGGSNLVVGDEGWPGLVIRVAPDEITRRDREGEQLITVEQAGFTRGWGLDRGRGTVSVSTKHTLALTHRGGATTAELLELAVEIRAGVEARFGSRLAPEAHLRNCTF